MKLASPFCSCTHIFSRLSTFARYDSDAAPKQSERKLKRMRKKQRILLLRFAVPLLRGTNRRIGLRLFPKMPHMCVRFDKKLRRIGPLLQNHGPTVRALLQALQERPNAGVVLTRGTGEQGQVAIAIAVVFVRMNVDDRNLSG